MNLVINWIQNNYFFKALGVPVEGQLLFQTPASPYMEGIVDLHHYIMFFLVFISIFVSWLLIVIMFSFNAPDMLVRVEKSLYPFVLSSLTAFKRWSAYHSVLSLNILSVLSKRSPRIFATLFSVIRKIFPFFDFNTSLFNLFRYSTFSQSTRYKHGTIIEFVWTVFPCVILLLIAIPSYKLLFSAEDVVSMHHVIKVIGHQWYWTYEYTYVVDEINSLPPMKPHVHDSYANFNFEPKQCLDLMSVFHPDLANKRHINSLHMNSAFFAKFPVEISSQWSESLKEIWTDSANVDVIQSFKADLSSPRFDRVRLAIKAIEDKIYLPEIRLYKPDFNFNLFYLLLSKDVLKHLVQVAPDVLLNKSVGYLSDSFINEFHSKTHSFTGENSLFTYFFDDTRSFVVKSLFITSYMLAEDDLPNGGLRLLEVDNVLRVPAYTHLHFLITSSDVIHSWAVPSLGIKVDAVPGRLNENVAYIARPGVFYGQCSEICGVNHAFMPICVVAYDH